MIALHTKMLLKMPQILRLRYEVSCPKEVASRVCDHMEKFHVTNHGCSPRTRWIGFMSVDNTKNI